ncbi:MAG: ribonuclease H-like YkuK family protein [Candidatus Poseidoniales archaeon]
MDHLTTSNWVSLGGSPISDIRDRIKKRHLSGKFTFHVGTDSKSYKDHTIITTTVCFREDQRGALVAYQRNKINNFNNITERLLHETIVSLEAAKMVHEITGAPPTIHADVNSKETALSNRMLNVIMGMVQGMGFPIKVKPDAWAADIADMYTR